ncbi:glycosyltransferase family 9 protein [Psychrilyobacter sp.]|uniref:glycosyltransferase family 9 protein n=1 Tax=Psychrilyobacter sp. TaxID=2586924 RepID=UPI0030162462
MGIRELNRKLQDFLRPKRLTLGRFLWDRKDSSFLWCFQRISKFSIINTKFRNVDLNIKKPKCELGVRIEGLKNQKSETKNLIEKENIRSILFIRNDGKIGDMIINTLMFREIKKAYPQIKIGVVTRGANRQVVVNNPHVDKIYDYTKSDRELKSLAKEIAFEKYDLLIDFSEMLRVKQMKFINLCRARVNMGLNKADWNLFDVSVEPNIDFKWTEHVTLRYRAYLDKLGIIKPNLDYDLNLSEEDKKFAEKEFEKIKENKVTVLNPYGASKHKTLSKSKLKEIIKYLTDKKNAVIFVYSPDKYSELESLVKELDNNRVYLPIGIKTINHTASLIEKADFLITPDTSIVHIGTAYKKNGICIYPPNGGRYGVDHLVWGPIDDNFKMIFCEDKKSENDEIDVNTFKMEELDIEKN